MYFILAFFLLIMLCIQVIVLAFNSDFNLFDEEYMIAIIFSLIAILSMLFSSYKFEEKYKYTLEEVNGYNELGFKLLSLYFIIIIMGGFLFIYSPSIDEASTLNGSQHVENLGFMFKIVTTFVPGISFTLIYTNPKCKINIFLLLFSICVSIYGSIVFLTKQPIFPYIFFGLFYFDKLSSLLKKSFLICLVLMVLSVINIYILRGTSDDLSSIINAAVFRFPLIIEIKEILNYTMIHGGFWNFDMKSLTESITFNIFGYNPYYIGIAPGYVGFFLSNFGWLGFFFSISFPLIFFFCIHGLLNGGVYSVLLYFFVILEFIPFFIDGNPTFYTSTSGNLLFYFLLIMLLFFKFKNAIIDKLGHG